jgi:hypothetical protein
LPSPVSYLSPGLHARIVGLASSSASRIQNAPSKTAPTKANTAHTASTSNLKERSTVRASLAMVSAR